MQDFFVTVCRRKYIPPLMECYQDILLVSVYNHEMSAADFDKMRA